MYRFSVWRTKRELDARSTELADPMLKHMTDRLARALDIRRVPVHIYEIDPVNGLAAPDGRIFITRGFYRKFQTGEVTSDEMASVIAHELGHVALGHTRRRMIDFSGQNALRTALAMILSRFLPGLGVWIANGVASLLAARLSRGDEYEADAYAAALLTKAGIGTEPQKVALHQARGADLRAGRRDARLADEPPQDRRSHRGDRETGRQLADPPDLKIGQPTPRGVRVYPLGLADPRIFRPDGVPPFRAYAMRVHAVQAARALCVF